MNLKLLRRTTTIAMVLALMVVMIGAFTRLTDAGLGCPDWPGCYGRMVLPTAHNELSSAQQVYPAIKLETKKAWTEMAHRYVAGLLGMLIVAIFIQAILLAQKGHTSLARVPSFLMGLVLFQATLGMWTVTLKLLPVVVMAHLLGGFLIFASLCYFRWQISEVSPVNLGKWRYGIGIACAVVLAQVALGGWVSANYAGIACVGFPACNGLWWPDLNLSQGFNLLSSIGENYQGGLLDIDGRITIQFIHRLGAVVTAFTLLLLSGLLLARVRHYPVRLVASAMMGLVLVQFVLGILNVVYLLPLWVAVAHNGTAALLFASILSMLYLSRGKANAA